eukprot:scaffold26193_cov32-Tisochrysis_lutea.AAC.2
MSSASSTTTVRTSRKESAPILNKVISRPGVAMIKSEPLASEPLVHGHGSGGTVAWPRRLSALQGRGWVPKTMMEDSQGGKFMARCVA